MPPAYRKPRSRAKSTVCLDFRLPYPTLTTNLTADLEAIALPDFDDPNIDKDAAIAGVLGTYFGFLILRFIFGLRSVAEDDSPYPEVRSAVANTDDPDIPVNTLRAWVLGLIWAIIMPVRLSDA